MGWDHFGICLYYTQASAELLEQRFSARMRKQIQTHFAVLDTLIVWY